LAGHITVPVDGIQDEFLNFSINNGFSQVVQSATRANNCLNLVFNNVEPLLAMYIVNVLMHPSAQASSVFSASPCTSSSITVYIDWNNANFEGISNYLAVYN